MKIRTFLLLTLLLVVGGTMYGQQLQNNGDGTQWTYWFPAQGVPVITPQTFSLNGGDTLIDDKEFFLSDLRLYTPEYEAHTLYLSEDSSGMYYYDPIRLEIRTLYNYTLQPGESYVIYPLIGDVSDSLVVTVDSIGMKQFGSEMLRVQYVSTRSVSHQERQNHWILGENFTDNKAVIVEHIGSLAFLLPQEVAWSDDFSIGICSFSSGDFLYQTNDTIDCDEPIVISVPEFVEQEVRVFPNPANTTLTVESDSPVREITIYDLTGRVMITVNVRANDYSPRQAINVVSLPRGIYLLRAVTDNGMKTARFVKN